jgi:hypothetical protein
MRKTKSRIQKKKPTPFPGPGPPKLPNLMMCIYLNLQ